MDLIPPFPEKKSDAVRLAREEPAFHIRYMQGVETLEEYQIRLTNAIRDNDRVVCKAVHAVGKTFIMARIAAWFLTSYENSIVLTTAPTNRQVNDLLWKEMRVAKKKAPVDLGGKIFEHPKWRIDDEWFALGYSPEHEAGGGEGQGASSVFQGYHAPNILIMFDEATGIRKNVWTQAEGMLTSGNVKFVAVGNPTSKDSEFYRKFKSRLWHKESITCFDSPNLKANGFNSIEDLKKEVEYLGTLDDKGVIERLNSYKVVNSYLVDSKFILSKAMPEEWGLEHILFITKCLGEFADEDDNSLFKLHEIETAQAREAVGDPNTFYIGVDPARYGSDKTIITTLRDIEQTDLVRITKKSTTHVTGRVIKAIQDLPESADKVIVLVDGTGLGAGVVDNLKEKQDLGIIPSKAMIVEVHFGGASYDELDDRPKQEDDKTHYLNLKAKMFDLLAKDIRATLSLLPDEVYAKQLPTIITDWDSKGRLKIESKKEYKKRTGQSSPDEADSLAIANYGRYVHYQAQDDYDIRITAL